MKPPKRVYDIKLAFRVWDPENECYQQDDADECHISKNGSLTCVFWGDCDTLSTEYVDQAKSVIERSIGLLDRHGFIIYDGDILKDGDKLWEVCWSPTLCSFMLDDYEYDENGEYMGSGNLESFHSVDGEMLDMEIVGNVHNGVKR